MSFWYIVLAVLVGNLLYSVLLGIIAAIQEM